MMNIDDIIKLIKVSVLITDAREEKTLTTKSIHYAFKILYMEHPELNLALGTGSRYLTAFTSENPPKLNNFKTLNKTVRDHFKNGNYDNNYKIGSNTIPYLCGIVDQLNHCVQDLE